MTRIVLLSCFLSLCCGPSCALSSKMLGRTEFDVALNGWRSPAIRVCDKSFRVVAYPEGVGRRSGKGKSCGALYLEYMSEGLCSCRFGLSLEASGETVRTFENNGGAIRGDGDEWICAMTFGRGAESDGYTLKDWGAHAWPASAFADASATRARGFVEVWQSDPEAKLRSGSVVVPVARSSSSKARLSAIGLASGGEYRVMAADYGSSFDAAESLTIRPAFHNRDGPWPVDIDVDGVEEWILRRDLRSFKSRFAYQGPAALVVASFFALSSLSLLAALRQVVGLYAIPSQSMVPTLLPGDLLLVDKSYLSRSNFAVGDVVVFAAPPRLDNLLQRQSKFKAPPPHSTFVKRIAALPGQQRPATAGEIIRERDETRRRGFCDQAPVDDLVKLINENNIESSEGSRTVDKDSLWVLGDCGAASVDSRVWGDLPISYVQGKSKYIVWPPSRIGPLN